MIPQSLPAEVLEHYARLRELTEETETKLRHVRDAEFWGAPVGTPLPLPGGMKVRVPQPVCDEPTSLDALPDVLQEFVNNSGTPDNPAHRREFKKAGKTIDVSVNDVAAHINETLDGLDEEIWQEGEQWYQKAHDECVVPWAKEFDIPEEVVAGVIAAISPRMPWDKNVEVAHELIRLWREEDDFGGLPDMDAAKIRRPNKNGEMKMLGLSDNVVQAIRCLRTGDVDGSVTGTKRRSFANNLYDPTAGYDVCNDGWMASMINRMYPDAGFSAAECDPWLGHTKTISKQEQPGPGGYVIIAEAVRKIAEERDLLPCQVQAIYWIAVGGGTNKPMYPQPKGEKKAARVVRSSWPFTDVANDPTGGDLTDPDHYDAEALRQGITTEINSAWWLIDGRYEYPSQNPRAAVLANADELKALLDGFLAVKARHVRDAAFWGAPVGTPLPLPRAATPVRHVADYDEMRDEYMRLAEQVVKNAEAIERNDELAPFLKQHVAEMIAEAMDDVPTDVMFRATFDARRYAGKEHTGMSAYREWDRYHSGADVFLNPSDDEHTMIAWSEGRLWEYDERNPPIAMKRPRGPIYAQGRAGSPEAEKAKRMFAVSELVHLWAVTSNDSNIPALAMQEVARDVFGLDDAEHWKTSPKEAAKIAKTKKEYGTVYERYLRAEYEATQKLLKGLGVTHVRLYRGYTTNGRHSGRVDPPRNSTTVSTRPMSSWSLSERTARNFSLGNGSEVVVTAEFPVERVLSTPLTGSGCWGESEMVVLGGVDETAEPYDLTPGKVRVRVKADGQPLNLDDGDLNADWIKTLRWDLPTDPGYYTPQTLAMIADLPAGRAMPPGLRHGAKGVRHVRDAAFWGAPVGTPLPLAVQHAAHEMLAARSTDELEKAREKWMAARSLAEVEARAAGYEGAGTPDDPVLVHGDVEAAKVLLTQGKSIRMDSVAQVGTLVTELAHVASEARAQGKKAPNYDLCRVSVPGTNLFCGSNLGIPRIQMPQLKGRTKDGDLINVQEDWKQALHEEGIEITRKVVPASFLKASQSELVGPAVALMIEDMLSGAFSEEAANAPIFVTKDGYVLDGHHRWAARVGIDTMDGTLGDIPMTVDMLDIEIGEAIDRARAYAAKRGVVPKKEVHIKPLEKVDLILLETKVRHVRDAEYWGAPVGTPLPLAPIPAPDPTPVPLATEPPSPTPVGRVGGPEIPFDQPNGRYGRMDGLDSDAIKWGKQDREVREATTSKVWEMMPEYEREVMLDALKTIREHGIVMVAQPQDIAVQIMRDGRIKSQFETDTSNGMLHNDLRAGVEYSMFGLPEDLPAEQRPIYGYVAVTNIAPLVTTQYGNIRFALKKSARERTRFTMDDSLDSVSIPEPLEGEVSDRDLFNAAPIHMFYEVNGEARLPADLDQDNPVQAVGRFERMQYIEAQILGGVSLDDVEAIYAPDLSKAMDLIDATEDEQQHDFLFGKLLEAMNAQQEILKIADKHGIPMYTYDGIWMTA